ncbi:MAG: hypothetical protein IT581_02995 [Verrucomicrobiales bacterium]|nr:hypothetical protein [Verrucomicrobiales bacterium]
MEVVPPGLVGTLMLSVLGSGTGAAVSGATAAFLAPAKLMAFDPALDEKILQEVFEKMQEEVSQGEQAVLEHVPFSEIRVLG